MVTTAQSGRNGKRQDRIGMGRRGTQGSSRPDRWTERGAALVEMSFVLPLFALFLFAIVGFGFLFQLRENMTHAAQEGLRASLYQPTADLVNSTAKDAARTRLRATLGMQRSDPPADQAVAGVSDCSAGSLATDGYLDVCTNYVAATGGASAYFPPCVRADGTTDTGTACLTITIHYNYARGPLFPRLPFISDALPSSITVRATGRVP